MNEYRHCLCLRARHPDADLSVIPATIGLPAKRIWKAGEPRTTPKGEPLEGAYRDSYYCSIDFEPSEKGLHESLSHALAKLSPHQKFLQQLTDKGVQLRFSVGWFSGNMSGDAFDWTLLHDLAEFRIGLNFNLYFDNDSETAP